ncbi:MAG: carbamoyltransferase [Deltaproteobacteria bacterium]|nr:carbamoyltransferase [Deltaproteobacteria bacterium]
MNILGISAFYHDSAACLMQDGQITAAAHEERFTRKRHDPSFPKKSIEYCLAQAGITESGVDLVAFYEKPFIKFERILESLCEYAPHTYGLSLKALPVWIKDKLWMKKLIWREFGRKLPVYFCGHHEAHAASAFFPSPFQEAATLTVDGVGEWSTTTWGVGIGNHLELRSEIRYPNSLGLLYSAFTQYLGFRVNSAEYKVMGLAPYGEPVYADRIKKHLVEIFDDGSFLLNIDYFAFHKEQETIGSTFESLFGQKRRNSESKVEKFHADIARSIQAVTEEIMLKLSNHVYEQTEMKNLCLAGGVALNCVANGIISREGRFKNIWIQPGAGDSGGALGSAYLAWHHIKKMPRPESIGDRQQGSFLGPEYGAEEIEQELKAYGLQYKKYSYPDMVGAAATILAEQKILGWFQGRMEFGPRALGSRSILGDARNPEMQKRMNLKIKFRESFRPFAPSVIAEDAAKYFELDVASPYMLLTCQVKGWAGEAKIAVGQSTTWISEMLRAVPGRIPAVTHVDGSARVHTVERGTNPLFYELLQNFKKATDCPVLINTSFNVRGEPIVCSPRDAIRCFLKTDIDALAIGPFITDRNFQDPANIERWRETLKKEDHFELD